MSVDVEDYYHASALSEVIKPQHWKDWPSHVDKNTDCLLQLFDERVIRATFFILGWVAEKSPHLIRRISEEGHEIACHGYSHQLIYQKSPEEFREETYRAKSVIEALCARDVLGYRAASYSITMESLWAIDILAKLGFVWDPSIFPIYHDRYGMPGTPDIPYEICTEYGAKIIEFPLTIANVFGACVPAAGGGYFRQFPYWLFSRLFKKTEAEHQLPQMFYIHPREVDQQQPEVKGLSRLSQFRHYRNINCCQKRLQKMLVYFEFGPVSDLYKNLH
ncbi:MAG: DUF3473 domain-containing protein [Pseudomonadales bacterium]|nr:DUF3473 domain-containing protein [Pseudomonadales bacterium]